MIRYQALSRHQLEGQSAYLRTGCNGLLKHGKAFLHFRAMWKGPAGSFALSRWLTPALFRGAVQAISFSRYNFDFWMSSICRGPEISLSIVRGPV